MRQGEVLGFAGLIGAGRTEVMRAIFGADPLDSGTIRKRGQAIRIATPADAMAAGIAYLPEDRKTQGLVLSLSGHENLMMSTFDRYSPFGFVLWRSAVTATREVARRLQFRGNLSAPALMNSGGNQQKLVIGKWVLATADVLIFDEPTRGIDVGAKAEIYRLIHELASNGVAIIIVSSEIMELSNLCHRIIVMSGGRIYDELTATEFDEHRILSCCLCGPRRQCAAAQPLQDRRLDDSSVIGRDAEGDAEFDHEIGSIRSGSIRTVVADAGGGYGREIGLPAVVLVLVVIFSVYLGCVSYSAELAQHRRCCGCAGGGVVRTDVRGAYCGSRFVGRIDRRVGKRRGCLRHPQLRHRARELSKAFSPARVVGLINGLVITRLEGVSVHRNAGDAVDPVGLGFESERRHSGHRSAGSLWRFRLRDQVLGIPAPFIVALVVLAVSHLTLRYTRFGRQIYAVGGNQEAARLSGIQINRVKVLAYVFCSFFAAIGSIVLTARVASGQPTLGRELAARIGRCRRSRRRFAVRRARLGDRRRFRRCVRQHPVERAQSSERFVLHADDGDRRCA